MPSGKRLPPTRFPLPLRLAAALPLGTLFVGSGLVGLPAAAASSDPPAPLLTFSPATTMVEAGEEARTDVVISPGVGDVCLFDLTVDGGFELSGELAPGQKAPASVGISGVPDGTTEVNATVTYAEVEKDAECPAAPPEDAATATSVAPFVATVQKPTEEPTDEPTDDPSPSPTPSPTGSSPAPSPTGSSDPEPTPTGSSSPPESPTPTSTGGGDGGGDGGNENGGGSSGGSGSGSGGDGGGNENGGGSSGSGSDGTGYAGAPPHSGVPTDDPGAGAGGAELPELPTGAPDLPGLGSPSGDDPLAELPSVEPGEGDDTSRTTEMAASEKAPTSMVTPAVLVLFLLLLLLFATPLAPSRRVRIGPSAYKGRRRKR